MKKTLSDTAVFLEEEAIPGAARMLEVRPLHSYALILNSHYFAGKSDLIWMSLEQGTRKELASESNSSCSSSTLGLPSPLGSRIALLTIHRDCMDDAAPQTAELQWLDQNGDLAIEGVEVHAFASYPSLSWMTEDRALLTDAITSIEFDLPFSPEIKSALKM